MNVQSHDCVFIAFATALRRGRYSTCPSTIYSLPVVVAVAVPSRLAPWSWRDILVMSLN